MNSHKVFIHIHQGCFAGTGAIVRLPQCQWSKLDGYGKISQCITTTKHSKAKTVCTFLGTYCILQRCVEWTKLTQWKNSVQDLLHRHNSDVIASVMASQITSVSIICSTVCSGVDQRKHQSYASLAFVRRIHRWPMYFPCNGPVKSVMNHWMLTVTPQGFSVHFYSVFRM